MKKRALLFFVILGIAALATAGDKPQFEPGKISFTASAGIRNIPEKLYEQIFGNNNLTFGLDLAYRVAKPLEIYLHTDIFSVNGETTLTGEKASLSIFPIELGARLVLIRSRLIPYLGAGLGYYLYKDKMEIDGETVELKNEEPGFFGEGGLRFYFNNKFFVDLKAKYVLLTAKADEAVITTGSGSNYMYIEERKLGGFALMGGLGISF